MAGDIAQDHDDLAELQDSSALPDAGEWDEQVSYYVEEAQAIMEWFRVAEPWLRKWRIWGETEIFRKLAETVVDETATLADLRHMAILAAAWHAKFTEMHAAWETEHMVDIWRA